MADWTNLPNLAVGVGGLPSGTTVTALRDNPIAIAEGAAGAPRVEARAIEFVDLALRDGSGTSALGWLGLDPTTVIRFYATIFQTTTGTRTLQIRGSNNGGSSYGSWIVITKNISQSESGFSIIQLNLATGFLKGLSIGSDGGSTLGFDLSIGVAGIDAVQFRASGTNTRWQVFGQPISRGE